MADCKTGPSLEMRYSGRIIDHLGIQMYQSPVAAVAELVANAWDADASRVTVRLPGEDTGDLVVVDDGVGMTLEECQERFLNVGTGRRRRGGVERTSKGRKALGRKGIGKLAGFGIADVIVIDSTSATTGERTRFRLDLNDLRSDDYVTGNTPVPVEAWEPPDESRRALSGTTICLRNVRLPTRFSRTHFARGLARRFLVQQYGAGFDVSVDGEPLPDMIGDRTIQFSFPRDYEEDERPQDLVVEDDWGLEDVTQAGAVRWRVLFAKDPIDDDELRGVSVLCNGKLAQTPFFFELSGGLHGQHGNQYVTGQVQADYIDEQAEDLIAPERQRVNWQHPLTEPLLAWGQRRLKELLTIWHDRRGAARLRILEEKVEPFAERLVTYQSSERRPVRKALEKLAQIPALSDEQFREMGDALLTAWERGRLLDLIDQLTDEEAIDDARLVEILAEVNIISALNVAEAVTAKIGVLNELAVRVEAKEYELPLRDRLADNPWVLGPKYETFAKERVVPNFIKAAATEAKLEDLEGFNKRVDLVLHAGNQMVVVELMRPGVTCDWDHVERFRRYVTITRTKLRAETRTSWSSIGGVLVADKVDRSASMIDTIQSLQREGMEATDWSELLAQAVRAFRDFLEVLYERSPDDARLGALRKYLA